MNEKMINTFNDNLQKIKLELTRNDVASLYAKYNPEDDSHLAKIITLRGVKI